MFPKFGTPLFDTMRLVHNHEETTAAPPGLLEQCREPTVAETHLGRCQDYSVKLPLQVLWAPLENASAYNEHSRRTFRMELSRVFHVSPFTATAGTPSLSVKKRA